MSVPPAGPSYDVLPEVVDALDRCCCLIWVPGLVTCFPPYVRAGGWVQALASMPRRGAATGLVLCASPSS